MAVTFNQAILGTSNNGTYGTVPVTTAAFTPGAGDTIAVWALDYGGGSPPLAISGTGTYSNLATDSNFHGYHILAANTSASAVSQTLTANSTAGDPVVLLALDYSGAGTVTATYTQNVTPGTGAGGIVGASQVVPTGSVLVAIAIDLHTGDANDLVGAAGSTSRGTGILEGTLWPYLISEYAGAGSAIQPTFTDSVNGAGGDYFVAQFLLSPGSGTVPTVTSVNASSSISEGTTAVPFVGTNFASGLTCAIEQYLSGTLDATVTQANPIYTDATDGKFDLTMEPAGTQLAFTDSIYTHKLKVTVGANSGDGSIAGGLTPPAGLIFKTLTSYNSGSAYVITASGTLVVNDQLEASGNSTGTTAAPAGLSINADGTWSYANGYAVQDFYVRAYDSTTQTWGAWALQSTSVTIASAGNRSRRYLGWTLH